MKEFGFEPLAGCCRALLSVQPGAAAPSLPQQHAAIEQLSYKKPARAVVNQLCLLCMQP